MLERCDVTMSGPQFEFRIAVGTQPGEVIVAAGKKINPRERLRVAAIEPFGQPHDRRKDSDSGTQCAVQIAVPLVGLLGSRLPMVSGDQADDLDLLRIEAPQISIFDQIVRVTMMAIVTDVYADVVEQRPVFQPLPLALRKTVHTAGLIEDAESQPRDLLRMLRPITATLPEFDHTPPPHVRVALDLSDAGAVPVDIVEHEPFAEREIAEGQVFRSEAAQNRVEQHRTGDVQVRTARIESIHLQPFLDVGFDQTLSQTV